MSEEGVLGVLVGLGAVAGIIGLAICILMIVAVWKIFTKAGEKGWKSIIPIYNGYTTYKISWKPMWYWITLALAVLVNIIQSIAGTDNTAVSIIVVLLGLAEIVIAVVAMYKLSKSFGHGVGFTIGLILLAPIFLLILAFGSSQYIGPEGNGVAGVSSENELNG